MNDLIRTDLNPAKDLVIATSLFIAAIAFLSLDWLQGIGGGVSSVGAERIMAGEIPYRDFWTMYAPGHFYLSALIFSIFGSHILVDWVSGSVITAAAACACYLLARNFGGRFSGIACAVIFLAAMYNTGYFKHVGSYPPSSLLIFAELIFATRYFRSAARNNLFWAGLLTGAAIVFKHDVGGYTAIATAVGLIFHSLCTPTTTDVRQRLTRLLIDLLIYLASCVIIVFPILLYFAVLAGPDMLQDLVIFPLTDFPFSRPELYPSLWPSGVFEISGISRRILETFNYLCFALPFLFFVLGVVALVIAIRKRQPEYAGPAVIFCILYVFHYAAAHVQINTHIVSMSVYGVLLGLLFYRLAIHGRSGHAAVIKRYLASGIAATLLFSQAIPPLYSRWSGRKLEKTALDLPKVSGTRLPPEEAQWISELWAFVNDRVPPGEPIYVGLHRHDVTVIGDHLLYFILDRPGATRYDELHPAITDTSRVQHEMIGDLQEKNVRLIVLKHIFSNAKLDEIKQDYQRNLPNVGATGLDDFIRGYYFKSQQIGPYEIWLRRANGSFVQGTEN